MNTNQSKNKHLCFKHIFKTLNTHFIYNENEERKKRLKVALSLPTTKVNDKY
jgi:hypothetical protein